MPCLSVGVTTPFGRIFSRGPGRFTPSFVPSPREVPLLMSEDTPKKIDGFLYRFRIQLFDSRERRLVSGLAGSRP